MRYDLNLLPVFLAVVRGVRLVEIREVDRPRAVHQSAETVRGLAIAAGPVVAAIHLGNLWFVRYLPSREQHRAATAELAARGIPGPDGVTPTVADPER